MEIQRDHVSPQQAASMTGRSYTYVVRKCKAGEVPGAEKRGKYWEIPHHSLGTLQKRPNIGWEKKAAVIELRRKGLKYEAIARKLGISKSYVHQLVKRHEEEEEELMRLSEDSGAGARGRNETATLTAIVSGRIFMAEHPVTVRIGEEAVWEMGPGDILKLSYAEDAPPEAPADAQEPEQS